jgi:hypothetical protein
MKKMSLLVLSGLMLANVACANPIAPTTYYDSDNRYVCIDDGNAMVLEMLLDTSKPVTIQSNKKPNGDIEECITCTVVPVENDRTMCTPQVVNMIVYHNPAGIYGKIAYGASEFRNFAKQSEFILYWFAKDFGGDIAK